MDRRLSRSENETPAGGTPYRVDQQVLKGDWPVLLFLSTDLVFGLWALGRMPSRVPIHWGITGEPDSWGPAWVNAIFLPLVGCGVYALLLTLPLIDPRRRNYALFPETLRTFRFAIPLFLVFLHVMVVLASLGRPVDMTLAARLGLPLLFIVIGNSFGRIRHNYFFGIRVPWTLNDEEVWNATHRMAARLWVACGMLQLGAALLPLTPGFIVMFVLLGVMVIVPIVYSYLCARKRGM